MSPKVIVSPYSLLRATPEQTAIMDARGRVWQYGKGYAEHPGGKVSGILLPEAANQREYSYSSDLSGTIGVSERFYPYYSQ